MTSLASINKFIFLQTMRSLDSYVSRKSVKLKQMLQRVLQQKVGASRFTCYIC